MTVHRRIQNLFKHIRWSVYPLTVNGLNSLTDYAKNTPSQMIKGVVNTPLQYQISLQMRLAQFTDHMKKAKK